MVWEKDFKLTLSKSSSQAIDTHGKGNAGNTQLGLARDGLNEWFGPGIFNQLDAVARMYARGHHRGCQP